MTRDELWLRAVTLALGNVENGYNRKLVGRLLDEAGGDVAKALSLLTRRPAGGGSTVSFRLGNWGYCGSDCRLECWGSAASADIQAWDGPDHWDRPPDLVVTWREVFEYVAGQERQLSLL